MYNGRCYAWSYDEAREQRLCIINVQEYILLTLACSCFYFNLRYSTGITRQGICLRVRYITLSYRAFVSMNCNSTVSASLGQAWWWGSEERVGLVLAATPAYNYIALWSLDRASISRVLHCFLLSVHCTGIGEAGLSDWVVPAGGTGKVQNME